MPASKTNWKLFFHESGALVLHTLLAAFCLRLALLLFEYYRAGIPALLFLSLSICYLLPLCVNFLDLWARTIASLREDALAERLFKKSILIHQKLFGACNASMSAKQAMLASLYFDSGRLDDARLLFEQSWLNFEKSALKLPTLHAAFSSYLKILDTTGDIETQARVKAQLKKSKIWIATQRALTCLLTLPVVAFLLYNQVSEISIAQLNARGQVSAALSLITQLAEREAFILGNYAAAKVYKDYALAFEDCQNQPGEMAWCAVRSLSALRSSGEKDEYLKVCMLNIKGKACLLGAHIKEAARCFEESVEISRHWSNSTLAEHAGDARSERDKALVSLAEIYRNSDEYEKAEALYKIVLGLDSLSPGQEPDFSRFDPVETIDKLHKLQHIELKLGKKTEAITLQKSICAVLEKSVQSIAKSKNNSALRDFGVREASRELDVCALMLQESGKNAEAEKYSARSLELRNLHQKSLRLNAAQQDSVVDASLRITRELLSVKYRDEDCSLSLDRLLNEDLKSTRARGAFESLPWIDSSLLKLAQSKSGKAKKLNGSCKLEVEIAPLSIRNSREGDGITVDVQGTVRILSQSSQKADEERFAFAYVLKNQNSGKPSLDYLLDNQSLSNFGID